MEYLQVTDASLSKAANVLLNGGIVAFPTETVYGLGADAFNPCALVKIFEAKGRPRFDPLIIHIASVKTLRKIANLHLLSEQNRRKFDLLQEKFWPGPLSLVIPKNDKIPGIATSGLPAVAVRIPANETAQKLISLSGGAIAAPSANPFGSLSPTSAAHVKDNLGDKVDIILDGGQTEVGIESAVLDLTGSRVCLLRHGGVPKEDIENVIGKVIEYNELEGDNEKKRGGLVSPGQLKSHYAPKTPLAVFTRDEIPKVSIKNKDANREDSAWLFFDNESFKMFQKNYDGILKCKTFVLSPSGSLPKAAARLFEVLHELDALGVKKIYAELAPNAGLGEAINDRLKRAKEKFI